MISVLLLTLIPLVSSNVCREECDNAFIWYTYDVCWTKYYYGDVDAAPINSDCIDECNSKTIECMENQQCFDPQQTWCDSWPCDCSWQCDYFNSCSNEIINNEDIDCAFQETCYAACPDEDDGYHCVEENCMEELEQCFYDEACLNAVESFDAECHEHNGGDFEFCIENADEETLNRNCEDLDDGSEDIDCVESFGALGACVLDNDCHKNMPKEAKKQALGLKRYGEKKKSLKHKNAARNKRLKVERERKLKRKSKAQKLGRKQFEQRRRNRNQRKQRLRKV